MEKPFTIIFWRHFNGNTHSPAMLSSKRRNIIWGIKGISGSLSSSFHEKLLQIYIYIYILLIYLDIFYIYFGSCIYLEGGECDRRIVFFVFKEKFRCGLDQRIILYNDEITIILHTCLWHLISILISPFFFFLRNTTHLSFNHKPWRKRDSMYNIWYAVFTPLSVHHLIVLISNFFLISIL